VGQLFRAILFNLGPGEPLQLLMIGHYVVADVLSWQTFVADLDTALRQLSQGQPIDLPQKTTAIKQYTERIVEYAQSPDILGEIPFWLDESRTRAARLPVDFPGGANTIESSRHLDLYMSVEETESLLAVAKAYDSRIHAVLLTAIARVFTRWIGSPSLLFELYVLGREAPFEDVDLSRSVGWLTFAYPMLTNLEQGLGMEAALRSMTGQLRAVPRYGIGYPSLRYVRGDEEIAAKLRAMPEPEMFFNFFGSPPGRATMLRSSRPLETGRAHDRKAERVRLLTIAGYIIKEQLYLFWEYSENVHKQSTIQSLVDSCRETLRSLAALR
jgi:non-ribosomal peptide synthase protein (TIGR01720 family)